ncbi:S9 family peptidase [Colwellia psychrerythraea]|uniref:Peptidase S9B dipeptidylpeptidase IV domain protein n=1 Tax=Colwellia psychrerythraea TaxID=28229 RepID=A0A099KAM3_COLPS|nr:prolyl oligopeptidase family serine peptidase [Colwellia psychrerythraea]KGJ87406.1 peptidase S9B dipeptidylpeptidase IV domain protein [Colwellia psychrerythraea]
MKIQLIAAALSFSLAACSNTQLNEQVNTGTPEKVKGAIAANAQATGTITLEQVMADPDWFGRAPESWYWGDDSNTVYYQQKQLGNPLRDLYAVDLSKGNNTIPVALANKHKVADQNGRLNQARSHKVYTFNGDVFVKTLATNVVKQLTFTSNHERNALFLTNGDIAYQVSNVFYAHNMQTGQIKELASLKMVDKPAGVTEPKSYLAKEQHKLIDYIALGHRNSKLKQTKKQRLAAENTVINDSNFYFGKGNKVAHASLSPAGDKLLVSITSAKSSRDKTDIMPNYITKDGIIAAEKVRARVANNREYQEQLFIIDLATGSKEVLIYDNLPSFDTDVLASVKTENYAREGKTYKSEKKARNIHVLQMYNPIKWSVDGQHLALMLEAWDNKTRWLTTVDFAKSELVTQHKLHDDAWINWSFNEFGWLAPNGTTSTAASLYYLSEESGYSHLYHKNLNAKAVKLTSGKFEVSNVTAMQDNQRFIFKANKKHPGIYEIYQVDMAKKITALTDLGGKNAYSISPDESKLLIEHSTVTMPPELYVQALVATDEAKRITHTVSEQFLAMPWASPTVIAIPSSNQKTPIYSKVYLPKNYDKTSTKNRAVMFTHGAGYLQNSHLGWSGYFREYMFHSMLVQQGYVVIDMDYRASAGYGRDWRTAIYRHMGKVEVEDMRDGVNWLVENANVDAKRVGTYGGSYGGFLTLMSLFTDPDLFASGAAIRLVSDWAYYNHGYTSNILNTPADDAIAYERSSPIYFAEGLSKPLLINAPMVDDNVFFEDTVRLVQRLIELEKQDFETAIYPVEPHGFVQPSSWLDEYRRIYKLFENTL